VHSFAHVCCLFHTSHFVLGCCTGMCSNRFEKLCCAFLCTCVVSVPYAAVWVRMCISDRFEKLLLCIPLHMCGVCSICCNLCWDVAQMCISDRFEKLCHVFLCKCVLPVPYAIFFARMLYRCGFFDRFEWHQCAFICMGVACSMCAGHYTGVHFDRFEKLCCAFL